MTLKKVLTLVLLICMIPILADQWFAKGPVSYSGHSSIFEVWLAEVFPKNSRLNKF